jgi:hypothetical protein
MENDFIMVQVTEKESWMIRRAAIRYIRPRAETSSTIVFGKADDLRVKEGFDSLKNKLFPSPIDELMRKNRP